MLLLHHIHGFAEPKSTCEARRSSKTELLRASWRFFCTAILICGAMTMLTSCSENDDPTDNNNTPAPSTPSAVDNGVWPINEAYVDNTVRPGDDFFMHRIGLWWAATTVDDSPEQPKITGYTIDLDNEVAEATPASPSVGQLSTHLADLDAQSGSLADFHNKVWEDCGYEEAATEAQAKNSTEPLWKCLGRMMAQGAAVPFVFDHFCKGGKVVLMLATKNSSFPYKAVLSHRKWFENADFCRSLVPLVGGSGTRTVNDGQWPHLVTMVEAAGIDPALVYLPSEHSLNTILGEEVQKDVTEQMNTIEKYCNYDVTKLAKLMTTFGKEERDVLSCEVEFQAYQESFRKAYNAELTKDNVVKFYKDNYLSYEFSYLVGQKFVTDAFRQDGVEKCKAVISVFADRIKANTWLSDEGKQGVLEKLNAININVGCPEKWITEAVPDLSKSTSALEDAYLMRRAAFNYYKYLAGKSLKDVSFHLILAPNTDAPLSVLNAFYDNNYNSINIYPWWLMKPCYDLSYNQAVNYAVMSVVAHEITHGFDSEGYKFNKDGDPISIFTNPADEAKFVELGKKLVARFDELEVLPKEIPGVMSKGEYCLKENIADLGGVEIAFDAYTRYLTEQGFTGDELVRQQQRFFYAYTEQHRAKYGPNYVKVMQEGWPATDLYPALKPDGHSLNRERVNGIFRNVDSWYDLFGVKQGDALYLAPADRVHIW